MTISVTKPSVNLREKLNELDFDRVPFQKMPAGSVLQVVSAEQTASVSSTTGSPVNAVGINITPVASNSKILIHADWSISINLNDNYQCAHVYLYHNTTQLTKDYAKYYGAGTGTGEIDNTIDPIHRTYIFTPSYTLGSSFDIWSKFSSGTGSGSDGHPTATLAFSAGTYMPAQITVMEIAQ